MVWRIVTCICGGYGIGSCGVSGIKVMKMSMSGIMYWKWIRWWITIRVDFGCQTHCWRDPLRTHSSQRQPRPPTRPSNEYPLLFRTHHFPRPWQVMTAHTVYMGFNLKQLSEYAPQKVSCSPSCTYPSSTPMTGSPGRSHCSRSTTLVLGSSWSSGPVGPPPPRHSPKKFNLTGTHCRWTWSHETA